MKFFNLILFSLALFIGSFIVLNDNYYIKIAQKGSKEVFALESTESNIQNVNENATKEKPKDFKCLKCHKGSKSLENMAKEKNIDSAEKLRFLIREGPKSGLHITIPDEDLEKAIQYLDLP